ncbi:MAG: hypothetical protein C0501_26480 [Isosphaera sp.]|nr:hypothetical protein [Isosphaera sp.]
MTKEDDQIGTRARAVIRRLAECKPEDPAAAFEVGRDAGQAEAAGELAARRGLTPEGRRWAERALAATGEWLDASDDRGRSWPEV